MSTKRTPMTTEQRRELGRRAFRAIITREMGPTAGALERTDPAEFARQYEAAKRAHMASMAAVRVANAAELKTERKSAKAVATKPAPPVPFLWTSCPECNSEQDITLPDGVPTALCVRHYLTSKPWWPLGAHEWSIRKPWLVDGSLQAKTSRASAS